MDGARSIGIGKHELSGFVALHDEALSDGGRLKVSQKR